MIWFVSRVGVGGSWWWCWLRAGLRSKELCGPPLEGGIYQWSVTGCIWDQKSSCAGAQAGVCGLAATWWEELSWACWLQTPSMSAGGCGFQKRCCGLRLHRHSGGARDVMLRVPWAWPNDSRQVGEMPPVSEFFSSGRFHSISFVIFLTSGFLFFFLQLRQTLDLLNWSSDFLICFSNTVLFIFLFSFLQDFFSIYTEFFYFTVYNFNVQEFFFIPWVFIKKHEHLVSSDLLPSTSFCFHLLEMCGHVLPADFWGWLVCSCLILFYYILFLFSPFLVHIIKKESLLF